MRSAASSATCRRPRLWLESIDIYDAASRLGPQTALLLLHARGDEQIPYTVSEELHERAREPKRLLLLPGGHHRSLQHDLELQGVSRRFIRSAAASLGQQAVHGPAGVLDDLADSLPGAVHHLSGGVARAGHGLAEARARRRPPRRRAPPVAPCTVSPSPPVVPSTVSPSPPVACSTVLPTSGAGAGACVRLPPPPALAVCVARARGRADSAPGPSSSRRRSRESARAMRDGSARRTLPRRTPRAERSAARSRAPVGGGCRPAGRRVVPRLRAAGARPGSSRPRARARRRRRRRASPRTRSARCRPSAAAGSR